ncbi:MAG: hypothetical protein GY953_17945, partial [bacterium]|nr:hypothetical protein [bacterium]
MKRRTFLGAPLGGTTLLTGCANRAGVAGASVEELAGLTLEELRDQYRRDLFGDFLPFMEKYVIDHEYGGFLCNTDRDGTNITKNKRTWYEGRGIWVYSFLYNHVARESKYLEVARKSIEFILKSKPAARDAMWPTGFTREGKPLSTPDTAVYGDLFVAEGLAEYSKAAAEPKCWDLAKDIVLKCVRVYDRPDYEPGIGETYLGPGAPPFPGARIQG